MPLNSAASDWFRRQPPSRRASLFGLMAVLPPFVWWLGWFPGFVSSDSVDQLGQVAGFEFTNQHPAVHSFTMWIVTRIWDNPGMITLVQLVVLGVVLSFLAGRLTELGLPPTAAGVIVVSIAALPAVSTTTIAIWKDVPFTLGLIWAFGELLGLAADPGRWGMRWPPIRLGLALGVVWLFRHNGFLTVLPFLFAAWWLRRADRRGMGALTGTVLGAVVVINLVLYPLLGVARESIEPGTVFISDVAASLHHEPENFSADEKAYLATIAPLEVWASEYDCHDSTPLVFSESFDAAVITAEPGRFRSIVVDTYLRDPDTVLGHRWCAASYLLVPWQPEGAYFHRPPFEIAPNDLGIVRRPVSDRAYSMTLAVFQWSEPNGRLWLTWRPGLAILGGLVAVMWLGFRRRLAGLGPAVALSVAQLANVAATTPAQEFRFAFGLYLMGWLWIAVTVARRDGSRHRTEGSVQ